MELFILGDTSYGSCCVDEVAAQHASADAVVHFGLACMSPCVRRALVRIPRSDSSGPAPSTRRLPVLHVFGRRPLDADAVFRAVRGSAELKEAMQGGLTLVPELVYAHAMEALQAQAAAIGPHVTLARLSSSASPEPSSSAKRVGGFCFESAQAQSALLFLGGEGPALTNLSLNFPQSQARHGAAGAGSSRCSPAQVFSLDPANLALGVRREGRSVNRVLARRFYLVLRASAPRRCTFVAG